ncbi:MAG: cysteine synthase family protein [Candidatus Bathyarchaeota archaeon]|jgi:cysteine synthase A
MKENSRNRIMWNVNGKASESVFQLIGRTPLLKLERIPEKNGIAVPIFAKLEFLNPTGSLKDRIYYEMITKGIESGELGLGKEIIEASTGNAGISCSFIGHLLGYRVTIVMPEGMSKERAKMIQAFGGNTIFTKGGESDVDLDIKKIREIIDVNPDKYWWPDQYTNPNNPNAHYKTTGPEIWEQTNGKVDCFLASVGTGGTLTGIGRFLKEKDPSIKLYAVEPSEAPLLTKRKWGSHKIEGIGDGFVPKNLDLALLAGVITTTSEEAIEIAKKVALEEGIFCGISSGCNIAAAMKVAEKHPEFSSIVTMINDSGQRYFSTELCEEKKKLEIPIREHSLDEYTTTELDKNQAKWEMIG